MTTTTADSPAFRELAASMARAAQNEDLEALRLAEEAQATLVRLVDAVDDLLPPDIRFALGCQSSRTERQFENLDAAKRDASRIAHALWPHIVRRWGR